MCFSFSVNLYKVTGQFPWSSLRETDRGISTEFNVSVPQVFVEHLLHGWVLQIVGLLLLWSKHLLLLERDQQF